MIRLARSQVSKLLREDATQYVVPSCVAVDDSRPTGAPGRMVTRLPIRLLQLRVMGGHVDVRCSSAWSLPRGLITVQLVRKA